ncbi:MAG: hypothetical protein E7620_06565 [Ruminococcaceae bacterium]|nr:hypothetical protein [Oscillospiraceae bacterium]
MFLDGFELDFQFLAVISILVLFPLQLVLCFYSRRVWVKLLPIAAVLAASAVLMGCLIASEGWDLLLYLVLLLLCGILLLTCCVGWICFGVVRGIGRLKKRHREGE